MRTIGSYAFMGASRLTRVLFNGNQIQNIGFQSFKNCINLEFLFFNSESLTTLGSGAFENCPSMLKCGTITCPKKVKDLFLKNGFQAKCFNIDCPVDKQCTQQCRPFSLPPFAVFIAMEL
ncbi:leucine-rich repeat protein, putative [Trichomonas vaginalis G3]|uniref:Leucine-rich repeat protein, putative n=1 Tax=Trichomonas vaginalis (strain ATCC PRA-98 / G3) TaxID=412133 RepID=A2FII3_TRIV3|nr:leucine-rich repeat protein, putative [Trichomonas vaginalis G3]|eukprot:XP_001308230.1 leucine-rich repeat protein [Trichomonas vaginalis G3]